MTGRTVADGLRHVGADRGGRSERMHRPLVEVRRIREFPEGPNVVDDDDRSTMSPEDQVAIPSMHLQISDRHSGNARREGHPVLAPVRADSQSELGAQEEKIRARRILFHRVDEAVDFLGRE